MGIQFRRAEGSQVELQAGVKEGFELLDLHMRAGDAVEAFFVDVGLDVFQGAEADGGQVGLGFDALSGKGGKKGQ